MRLCKTEFYEGENQTTEQFWDTASLSTAQCLKITEKVSFIIASEASYVYILSGQKFIKNAKNGPFWWKIKNATFLVIFKHCAYESLLVASTGS